MEGRRYITKPHPVERFPSALHVPVFFLLLELEEQLLQPIERLVRIGADGFDSNARPAIEIGAQHLENAVRREVFLPFPDGHLRAESVHTAHEFRRRTRVQTEWIQDFDFSPHDSDTINDATAAGFFVSTGGNMGAGSG